MSTKIYHNPRCSKSRKTLQLLEENGVEPEIIEYLKTPPSKSELKAILQALDMNPRDLMRKGEAEYKENNLADESLSNDQLIDAMLKHPKLIERPIVVTPENKFALGRPPENVLDII
ncbi:MAG: arsenate reductase (glutaredoxin) [Gammaproteobacteria bacterium]|nr:arsenate reductase (glutaredoxin) [Gammaproteobacteria bacterium]